MFKIHALSELMSKAFFICVYLRPLRIKQAPWSVAMVEEARARWRQKDKRGRIKAVCNGEIVRNVS